MRPVRATARTLLSAIFVAGGGSAVVNPGHHVPQAERVTGPVAPVLTRLHPRAPTDTRTLIRINGTVQVASGLLLASGHLTRSAAAVLAGSLVPTTLAGHAFWREDDPTLRRTQRIHLLKNLGLIGGLLLAAVDTQGRPGLRWRTGHALAGGRRAVRRRVRHARRGAAVAGSAITLRRLRK